jgi:hypothetical protein
MGGFKDLFGDRTYDPKDKAGLELGYEAAERAAKRAGDLWRERAWNALKHYAAAYDEFTTEAVRLASPEVGEPPDRRAWGAIARRGLKEGLIEHHGLEHSSSPGTHGRLVIRWRSKGRKK